MKPPWHAWLSLSRAIALRLQRLQNKIDHLIERRNRIIGAFDQQARMAIADRCLMEQSRGERHIAGREFARGDALLDELRHDDRHAPDVLHDDRPILVQRGGDHFMQLAVIDIALAVHRVDRVKKRAQPLGRGAGAGDDGRRSGFDLFHQLSGDRFIDLGLGGEEAIDIGGRHGELARDVGDRRLLKADLLVETRRGFENPAARILFLGVGRDTHFREQPHFQVISSTAPADRAARRPICLDAHHRNARPPGAVQQRLHVGQGYA
jgi:hypothetical protein